MKSVVAEWFTELNLAAYLLVWPQCTQDLNVPCQPNREYNPTARLKGPVDAGVPANGNEEDANSRMVPEGLCTNEYD